MCIKKLFYIFLLWATLQSSESANQKSFAENAVRNQFPYHVSLRFDGKHVCSGSIINSSKILTAAYCVTEYCRKRVENNFEILAGVINRTETNSTNAIIFKVKEIEVHNSYNFETNDYDVAVISTYENFNFNLKNVAMIPLSKNLNITDDTKCVVSGWGLNAYGVQPQTLQFAHQWITPRSNCQSALYPIRITSRMICALGINKECPQNGDFGSPLVCNGEQVGVVSFAKGNVSIGTYPAVFARVPELERWLTTSSVSKLASIYCTILVLELMLLL